MRQLGKSLRFGDSDGTSSMNDRYPRDLPPHSDLASLARRLIDTEFPDPLSFIRKDSPILSLGSCFANHISDVLNAKGFDAFSVAMEEAENSTFATRLLLSTDDDRIINQLTQRELITLAALQERMRMRYYYNRCRPRIDFGRRKIRAVSLKNIHGKERSEGTHDDARCQREECNLYYRSNSEPEPKGQGGIDCFAYPFD